MQWTRQGSEKYTGESEQNILFFAVTVVTMPVSLSFPLSHFKEISESFFLPVIHGISRPAKTNVYILRHIRVFCSIMTTAASFFSRSAGIVILLRILFLFCAPVSAAGTMDFDKDGIPDDQDTCPYDYGTAANYGCPVIRSGRVSLLLSAAVRWCIP